jgi:Protein of unknown function (DUF3617)
MKTALALALFAAAGVAGAQDFPKLKAGSWEVTTANARSDARAPRLTTMCLDDSVQQEMYKMSTGMMSGMCSKHDIKVAAGKVTASANCDLGVTKMQSQSVMTLTGNTAYHTESHATFDPPMNGMKESNTVIDGKHVGACKPGQQPGDMTLPGGQTINIRQMMGRKS